MAPLRVNLLLILPLLTAVHAFVKPATRLAPSIARPLASPLAVSKEVVEVDDSLTVSNSRRGFMEKSAMTVCAFAFSVSALDSQEAQTAVG